MGTMLNYYFGKIHIKECKHAIEEGRRSKKRKEFFNNFSLIIFAIKLLIQKRENSKKTVKSKTVKNLSKTIIAEKIVNDFSESII